ncbi:MAG: hypothetical protein DMF73_16690 [Acidobacteria bacterium]|nr:MAG: hypothetical protein DMF73_16690 [Acidobacteriota bacterium]
MLRAPIAVLDGVHECFVKRDIQIRLLNFNQSQLGDAIEQVFEHRIHQGKIARQLQIDLLAHAAEIVRSINATQLE